MVLQYKDGTEEVFIREFDKSKTNEWQMLKSTIKAAKPFDGVKIYVLYYNQTGTVYFDNIKLEERSAVSQNEYDDSGNFLKSSTDALNNTSTHIHDKNGNLETSTDASDQKISLAYNLLNKLKKVTLKGLSQEEDITVEYEYDKQGNLTKRTDPRKYVTTFDYNAINKSTTETDPLEKVITTDYDKNGNLASITKGTVGNVIESESYDYDQKNRLKTKKVFNVVQFTNVYNAAGDKTSIQLNDGKTYTFKYDENHRLVEATEPGGFKLTNEYGQASGNTNGMRTKYSETTGGVTQATTFGYDGLHRLISVTGP